jgi:ADP-ribose pyrophosphatase YjhB (NUDIX family)
MERYAYQLKRYCLGFLFSPGFEEVVLIHKKRSVHSEMWNGLGGEVNDGEHPSVAMTREFKEECGLWVPGWCYTGILRGETNRENKWDVHVFGYVSPKYEEAESTTDEKIGIFKLGALNALNNLAPHVRMLVYASIDRMERPEYTPRLTIEEER